jgi:hypothetical protein
MDSIATINRLKVLKALRIAKKRKGYAKGLQYKANSKTKTSSKKHI